MYLSYKYPINLYPYLLVVLPPCDDADATILTSKKTKTSHLVFHVHSQNGFGNARYYLDFQTC